MEDFIQTFFYILITILAIVFSLIKQYNKNKSKPEDEDILGEFRRYVVGEEEEEKPPKETYFEEREKNLMDEYHEREQKQEKTLESTESLGDEGVREALERNIQKGSNEYLDSEVELIDMSLDSVPVEEGSSVFSENLDKETITNEKQTGLALSSEDLKKAIIYSEIINRKEY